MSPATVIQGQFEGRCPHFGCGQVLARRCRLEAAWDLAKHCQDAHRLRMSREQAEAYVRSGREEHRTPNTEH